MLRVGELGAVCGMGDFPTIRQLVEPVLRLRGGGAEVEAASPAPAPPLYPLPPDAARIAATTAVANAMCAPAAPAPAPARGGRHVRPRGPRERYSPGTEAERPQLGGGLGPDLLQRQVDQLGAREGDCVFELPLDEVYTHVRRTRYTWAIVRTLGLLFEQ